MELDQLYWIFDIYCTFMKNIEVHMVIRLHTLSQTYSLDPLIIILNNSYAKKSWIVHISDGSNWFM